jgi:hypothetical protein
VQLQGHHLILCLLNARGCREVDSKRFALEYSNGEDLLREVCSARRRRRYQRLELDTSAPCRRSRRLSARCELQASRRVGRYSLVEEYSPVMRSARISVSPGFDSSRHVIDFIHAWRAADIILYCKPS